MLPGIGGSELVLIAVVALIVVGPKDLPKMLRQLGRFVAKMRSMADEFRTSFDDMARQSELEDLRKEVEALRTNQISAPVIDDIREDMRRIENEIHDAIPPKGHYYSDAAEVPSPDAGQFDAEPVATPIPDVSPDYGRPSVANAEGDLPAPVSPVASPEAVPVKKPRKPRTPKAPEVKAPESLTPETAAPKQATRKTTSRKTTGRKTAS